MTTNKNLPGRRGLWLLLLAVSWLAAGCGPAGPRALLQGKRLMEQGNYPSAIDKLTQATDLMATNAAAWNYLGLAYQLGGQPDAAAAAYQKALKCDHELTVVHYNLGCLWLEQGQPDKLEAARSELIAYTLHQGNSASGWVKLGTVQLRLRDAATAEKSFWQALQISSNNPEALNGMGLAEWQMNRRRDALASFNAAVAQQPNYAPALLNSAILLQGIPSERALALQRYRLYLGLTPHAANADAITATALQLDQDLNGTTRPATEVVVTTARPPANNAGKPAPVTSTPTNFGNGGTKPEPTVVQVEPIAKPEVVRLSNPPEPRVVANAEPPVRSQSRGNGNSAGTDETVNSQNETTAAGDATKPGLLQRMNPFHREQTPVAESSPVVTNSGDAGRTGTTTQIARYNYVSPPKPEEGNRADAERFFAQAAEAQHDRRLRDAVALYRAATKADPSFFEAQSNLGLAAFDLGDMAQSLLAYEFALAIKPESFNARFNFALALLKANYFLDAAEQLEKLLAGATGEAPERLAMVHLTLANLYADQFHRPANARPHYQKVLQLDPQNSQATVIRYWLRDHP